MFIEICWRLVICHIEDAQDNNFLLNREDIATNVFLCDHTLSGTVLSSKIIRFTFHLPQRTCYSG